MKKLEMAVMVVWLTLCLAAAQDKKWITFEKDELEDMACVEARATWVRKIGNLQLEDKISRTEGRPAQNQVAIAKLQSKIENEDLYNHQEDVWIKNALLVRKSAPDVAVILQQAQHDLLLAVGAQRIANANGTEAQIKAARAKRDLAETKLRAAVSQADKMVDAYCTSHGGTVVSHDDGTRDCKIVQ